ncbi:MAG: hypothetical protein RLZZ627_1478 [Pseudomonadota bacterium]|jgi:hypothetical protein
MQKSRFFVLFGLLVSLSGCDLYLPGCGSGTTMGLLANQALKPFDIEKLAEIGMVHEISSTLKERQRVCQVTIQPKADFSQRYSAAKQKIAGGEEGNVLGMIGRALVSAALPDRLETTTIQFQIVRDERSQGFGVEIGGDAMDQLTSLAKGYKLADIAIGRISPEDDASQEGGAHSKGGNI